MEEAKERFTINPCNVAKNDDALVEAAREALREHGSNVRILDLGCGYGDNLDALADLGSVTGAGFSPETIEQAQAMHPNCKLIVADPCALPFKGVFDLVFSSGAFHEIADQVALLKSVASSLVDGGILVAEMGAEGNIARIEKGYTEAMRQHSGDYICQFCFPRETSYRRLLGIAGFEVERMDVIESRDAIAGGRDGLRLFAERFFAKSLHLYRDDAKEAILGDFEKACEDELWNEDLGCWMADCRRLRFVARKTRNVRVAGGASQLNVLGS